MRFGVFGCYTCASIGDLAILVGLVNELESCTENAHIHVFAFDVQCARRELGSPNHLAISPSSPGTGTDSGRPQSTVTHRGPFEWFKQHLARYGALYTIVRDVWLLLHPRFWVRRFREIGKLDLLVLGGGNILMDLYPSWPVYLPVYAALARLAGVPVVMYGVGAGPISSRRAKLYLRSAIRLCAFVAVRDRHSAEVLHQCRLAKHLHIVPDPALAIPPPGNEYAVGPRSDVVFGVNLVPFYDPRYWQGGEQYIYSKYIQDVIYLLNQVMYRVPCKMVFFSTNFPADRTTAHDVAEGLNCQHRLEVIEKRLSVRGVLDECARFDFILATRLHAAILSFVAGTPFVCLAYQPKVRAFCESLGLGHLVFDLRASGYGVVVEPEKVVQRIASIVESRGSLREKLAREKLRIESDRALGRSLLIAASKGDKL